MHWAISDIHGCYEEYRALLEKIHFSSQDTLYFLGDAVDRGPEPMKVVLDLAARKNVVPLLGNHDLLAWQVLDRFGETIAQNRLPTGPSRNWPSITFGGNAGDRRPWTATAGPLRISAKPCWSILPGVNCGIKSGWGALFIGWSMPDWEILLQTVPRSPTPFVSC